MHGPNTPELLSNTLCINDLRTFVIGCEVREEEAWKVRA